MFGKLRKWLRGKKKNVSINPKQRTRRKESLRKTKSLHDLEIMTQLENEGFRISSMDDFDIIPSAQVHTDGGSDTNTNASPISSGVVTGSPLNETNNNNEQLELSKSIPQINSEDTAIEIEDNSPEGSIVDLVTASNEQSNDVNPTLGELDLSLEMQALDVFDSIVNDIDETTAMPPTENERDAITDDSMSIAGHDTIVLAQPREQPSVDFDHVIGNLDSTTESQVENWSRVEPIRKSLMFRESAMYLPSERPELPPADYPETEDELLAQDDNISTAVQSVSNEQSPTHSPIPAVRTQSPPPNVKGDGDMELTEQPERVATTGVSSVTKTGNRTSLNGSSQKHQNDHSQTNGHQKLPTALTSSANGTVANSRHAPTPKKPKPRVTSFKSSGTPPRVKNTHDFSKLVEKFDKL